MTQSHRCSDDSNYNDENVTRASVWFDYLVVYFNVETCDMWEINVTMRSETKIKNIRSLGFQDIREGVTLRRLVLQSLECNSLHIR